MRLKSFVLIFRSGVICSVEYSLLLNAIVVDGVCAVCSAVGMLSWLKGDNDVVVRNTPIKVLGSHFFVSFVPIFTLSPYMHNYVCLYILLVKCKKLYFSLLFLHSCVDFGK